MQAYWLWMECDARFGYPSEDIRDAGHQAGDQPSAARQRLLIVGSACQSRLTTGPVQAGAPVLDDLEAVRGYHGKASMFMDCRM
ncbi:MAG: hypothetical protein JO046_03200 [Solirubrobacterales bacterium]|nr:hypothetical protein [Solirubrobacterales bacterium]